MARHLPQPQNRRRATTATGLVTQTQSTQSPRWQNLDKILTLSGFACLLGLAFIVAPGLANKQERDFTYTLKASIQALNYPASYEKIRPLLQQKDAQNAWENQLRQHHLTEIKNVTLLTEQHNGTQGIAYAQFHQGQHIGQMSLFYLNLPEMTLQNRWRLATVCRLDQRARQQSQTFVTSLRQQDWTQAQRVSTQNAFSLSALTSLSRELPNGNAQWQVLSLKPQLTEVAQWPTKQLKLSLKVDPMSCMLKVEQAHWISTPNQKDSAG